MHCTRRAQGHRALHTTLTLATVLLATTAGAQTIARTEISRGCIRAAPTDSLRTETAEAYVFRHDADAIYVVEAESVPLQGRWVTETSIAGHSGSSYLRWNGGNLFNAPGQGVMTYGLWCEQPQRFRLQMHNRHDHPDPSLENDLWMSVNGAAWRKVYSNDNRNAQVWNWHTRVDPGHGWFEFDLQPGMNELRISGRSQNFKFDRFHIFPRALGRLEDLSRPESERMTDRPVLGETVRILMGDPHSEALLASGSTFGFMMFSPSVTTLEPCGIPVLGLGADGGPGELLVSPNNPQPLGYLAGIYYGPSQPIRIPLQIPNAPILVGQTFYMQGLFAGLYGNLTRLVATDRLDLHIGDR
ncbi:MAG: hypothetical protein ACO4CT_04675 [Planctomycetota bacterium]